MDFTSKVKLISFIIFKSVKYFENVLINLIGYNKKKKIISVLLYANGVRLNFREKIIHIYANDLCYIFWDN